MHDQILKTAFKNVVHKTAEATGEFKGNKITDAVAKSNEDNIFKAKQVIDENSRNVTEKLFHQKKEKKY